MSPETPEQYPGDLLEALRDDELVDEIHTVTQESRYKIVDYLMEQRKGQARLSDIAGALDRDPSTVSAHLDQLSEIDAVEQPEPGALYEITDRGIYLYDRIREQV